MNSNTLSKIAAFTVGAAIGSAVTWFVLKEKYERIAREEIESVKETFARLDNHYEGPNNPEVADESEEEYSEEDVKEYEKKVQKMGYVDYTNNHKPDKEVKNMNRPYVIEPGAVDTLDDYGVMTLTYYNNDIVADDYGSVIDNAELDDMIGLDALTHFDENGGDEDTVYVRNDVLRMDYEILRDYSDYEED